MLTLHHSPFDRLRSDLLEGDLFQSDLFRKLEQQLQSARQPSGALLPAAEVHETAEAYTITLELPGVDKASIDVKASDRSLAISAERRAGGPDPMAPTADASSPVPAPLLSEIRYGTWSRSFRFASGIDREGLQAHYRDGLLTVTAPKAQTLTTVQVQVEG